MELIALVDIGRLGVCAGERFNINGRDGRVLKAIGKAKDVPVREEPRDEEPPKDEYRTRDMTAKKKK